jgi:multicomponent Na+:H+ antiporter subunit B
VGTLEINNVILKTVARIVVFIILTFAVYLFFSGHHAPGGGFIGGLVLASAFILLFLTFDVETIEQGIPFDFKKVAALGVLIVVSEGLGSLLFGKPFLSQALAYMNIPYYGELGLATITLFEAGVALTVVGVVVTIILSISEDV